MKTNDHMEISRRGGNALKQKYGDGHYRTIGAKGGNKILATRGPGYYKEMARRSVAARMKKRNNPAKPEVVLEKLGNLFMGVETG